LKTYDRVWNGCICRPSLHSFDWILSRFIYSRLYRCHIVFRPYDIKPWKSMKKAILDNIDEDVDDFFPGGSSN
jgi:hypothetical protein